MLPIRIAGLLLFGKRKLEPPHVRNTDSKKAIAITAVFYFVSDAEDEGTEEDTLEFRLKVRCTKNTAAKDSTDPDQMYRDHKG